MLASALTAVIGAMAYVQVKIVTWNELFYNALTNKDVPAFLQQLGVFAELAFFLLTLKACKTWLNPADILRNSLVDDLMTEWLSPLRAFRLSNSGERGANPDHCIQEDTKHLSELTADLGIDLLQSMLLVLSFVGVLWGLSKGTFLPIAGRDFAPPGYLVWCALVYAGAASYLSWRVGRPLINLNAERYAREAEFRYALVRVNEEIDGITLYGGEADERGRLDRMFDAIAEISDRIGRVDLSLTWITSGYDRFTVIAAILVAAPAYLRSEMSFGELTVIVGAFNEVQKELRWFVDNFEKIAEWRATLLRVAFLRKTILRMDDLGQATSQSRSPRRRIPR